MHKIASAWHNMPIKCVFSKLQPGLWVIQIRGNVKSTYIIIQDQETSDVVACNLFQKLRLPAAAAGSKPFRTHAVMPAWALLLYSSTPVAMVAWRSNRCHAAVDRKWCYANLACTLTNYCMSNVRVSVYWCGGEVLSCEPLDWVSHVWDHLASARLEIRRYMSEEAKRWIDRIAVSHVNLALQ